MTLPDFFIIGAIRTDTKMLYPARPIWITQDLGSFNLKPSAQGLQDRRGGASGVPTCFAENPTEMEQ